MTAKEKFEASLGAPEGTPEASGHSEAPLLVGKRFFDPALEADDTPEAEA